ncbi:MAG TPA: DUF6056 family protein [Veillonellaceae bacterium]|nr:DUF6056 family protein [Veillonellaceae bacterium]
MSKSGERLWVTVTCIFAFMLLLESLAFRFMGDDYIYSFMWEGHSMYVPLSENARRIDSFSDILASGYSYYMTWGGRVIAQMLAMFFLWIGRPWFNLAMAGGIILLLFSIQWIAHEGRITLTLRPFDILITFLCFWSFNINFPGTIVWIDGACNYFFPLLAVILFLLPYIHRYFMEDESRKSGYFIPLMFILGVLAGDSNENTICWIGLSGLLYLVHYRKRKKLESWMAAGMAGLVIGYGLLMLSPGNVLRMKESGETFQFLFLDMNHLRSLGFCFLVQSFLWMYLWMAYRRRKYLEMKKYGRHIHLASWFAVMSMLFNLIMLFSPESPFRAAFPSLIFLMTAVMLIHRVTQLSEKNIVKAKVCSVLSLLWILYFCFTFSTSVVLYYNQRLYMGNIIRQAESLSGKNQVLKVTGEPDVLKKWVLLTGMHAFNSPVEKDVNHWRNVAFARYYDIKGIYREEAADM